MELCYRNPQNFVVHCVTLKASLKNPSAFAAADLFSVLTTETIKSIPLISKG